MDEEWAKKSGKEKVVDPIGVAGYSKWLEPRTGTEPEPMKVYQGSIDKDSFFKKVTRLT